MGAEQAVGILNRREIAAAEDPPIVRRRLAGAYAAEHLSVEAASAEGFIDEVIAPHSTRPRIVSCLQALEDAHRPDSEPQHPAVGVEMLDGRRILVTGVLNRHSIAFATAAARRSWARR